MEQMIYRIVLQLQQLQLEMPRLKLYALHNEPETSYTKHKHDMAVRIIII